MEKQLTLNDPLSARILAWMDERFPFKNTPVWVVWYLLAALVARYSLGTGEVSIGFVDIFGIVATWSFFLLLRVYDEHKDYELDVKNYPERVLQSGLITLNHLKIIGVVCVLFQLSFALLLDGGFGKVTTAWLVMFIYSVLMAKEFFVGEWLEQRLVLYAVTHQLIVPIIVYWICCMGSSAVELTDGIWWLMALSFATSMTLEIVRKTRGPEEERDTVDSYSKVFGTLGSAYVVMGLATAMLMTALYLCVHILSSGAAIGAGVIVFGYLIALTSLLKFIRSPSLPGREKNEMACALHMLISYLTLIIAIFIESNVQFMLWV